jgi:uncharacterized protein (TIRG00374 family)
VLYPGRAGELLRVGALHKIGPVQAGEVLATAFLDRMADVLALGVVGLYVISASAVAIKTDTVVSSLVLLVVLPILAFLIPLTFGAQLKPLVRRLAVRLPGRWAERIPRWYLEALQACFAIRRVDRLAAVFGITVIAFCVDYTVFLFFFKAFDWPLPMTAAMTVGVFLAIASLVPAAPGYVGLYQFACVLALAPYGISESAALAYSIVAQGATILVIGLLGIAVAARFGLGLMKKAD